MRTAAIPNEWPTVESPRRQEVRSELQDYLARTGLAVTDFAHQIQYPPKLLWAFLAGGCYNASADARMCAAAREFIAEHPIARQRVIGTLHETENVRLLRKYFCRALEQHRAYYVYGAPGTQKSYVLQRLVTDLNQSSNGKRAYYIYVRYGIRPSDLLKRVAAAVGAITLGSVDRVLRNLSLEFEGHQVLLVFDEAQHLSVECLETLREVLDQPPHCGLLFAGSHQLEEIFTRQAIQLEQWKSRFYAGQPLPGVNEEEAASIIRGELGSDYPLSKVSKLIKKCRVADLRKGTEHSYVSARRLFWALRDLKVSSSSRL